MGTAFPTVPTQINPCLSPSPGLESYNSGDGSSFLASDASWKRLCSSSVPPDDDDDETAVGDIHQPFFYRYNTFENLTSLMSMLSSGVGARF